jgi:hypothetical protein
MEWYIVRDRENWVPGALPPIIRLQGHEADYQPYLTPRLRVGGAITPLPSMSSHDNTSLSNGYVLIAWCLVKPRDNLIFAFY